MMNASNSIMLLGCLGIQLIVFKTGDCSIVKTSWTPVPVSNASLQDSSVKTQEINSVSDITCSILATKSRWANLFCYENGLCSLFDLLAVTSWNDSLIADPVNCMTKLTGCVFNQETYSEYELVTLDGFDTNECSMCLPSNQFATNVEFLPPNQTFSTCEEPFKQTTYGCLGHFVDPVDYCTAVKKCYLLGGTLASLEMLTSKDQLPAFADELGSIGTDIRFWTGAKKNGETNNYIFTKSRNYLTDQNGLWNTGYPKTTRSPCVLTDITSGLRDIPCYNLRNYVCERRIN